MKFSSGTLSFLEKAGRQKSGRWLDRNRDDYERFLLEPFQHLAQVLKRELRADAPLYHFPQKAVARLKRSARSIESRGGGPYKNWISYSAARIRTSRFEHNPNIFFLINTEDKRDPILLAGGLYFPSSKQMRALREAIARDASAFERLFASREFSKVFPGGFSLEKTATRPPRGFDPGHPKITWLKLQAFFVWKPYKKREFTSQGFAERVACDCRQILKLNELLEQAIRGVLPAQVAYRRRPPSPVARISELEGLRRGFDF